MNQDMLKTRLKQKLTTQQKMADCLGISLQSFNGKINGRYQFTLKEVVKMIQVLEIQDPEEIFFADIILNMQQGGEK